MKSVAKQEYEDGDLEAECKLQCYGKVFTQSHNKTEVSFTEAPIQDWRFGFL